MRKFYSRIFLGFLAMACSYFSFAQISVTATAGTTGPTTYTTLKLALDAVNAGTHQGNITITVNANTTETAAMTLVGSGKGAASYASILIKPAATTNPIITGKFNSFLLSLDSVRNLTIDGSNVASGTTKNLTFQITDSTGNVLLINNSSSNNIVKNSIFKGASPGSGVIIMGFAGGQAAGGCNNNTIENNDITKSTASPGVGIFNLGTSGKPNTGNIYRNNRISDFVVNGFRDGNGQAAPNNNGYSNNTLVEGNEIYHTSTTSAGATGSLQGIRLINTPGIQNMTISKNVIHDLYSTSTTGTIMGIDLFDADQVTVVNNIVSLSNPSTSLRGIAQETGAGAVIKIYYNTVLISGTATGTAGSFAFLKNYTSTNDDIKNNIFVNTRISTGTAQYAFSKTDAGTFTSNYNDLISTGNTNNILGSITTTATTDYNTLATWQAGSGGDANSVSIAPVFVSATDLHLSTAANLSLDNKGTPITGITTDIDNQTRSTTTPDVGADEFTSSATCTNPAITAQPTNQAACNGANVTFNVTATGTGLTYQWRLNGANVTTGTGGTTASYTVAAATATAGSYTVVVSSGACSVTSNAATLTLNAATAITAQPTSITRCQGNATFSVTATGSNLTYQWTLNGVNVPGATTANVSIPINASTPPGTYNVAVVVSGACGNVTSNNAVLTIQNCTSVPDVDAQITSIVMTPNVVRDVANVRVTAAKATKINWNIVDAQGKIVMTLSSQVAPGKNDIALYVGQLSNGTYQLKGATSKGATEVIRFVKM